jgi:hypothetical protein
MVVNNSRFLVLPERQRHPNLASRAPGLCLKRLSADWKERWGHPVLGVESFVDETRYRGACYRACGFEAVGPTKGFARASRDFCVQHGQPKQLYLREPRPSTQFRRRHNSRATRLRLHSGFLIGPAPQPDHIAALQSPPLQRKYNFHPSTFALSARVAQQNHQQLRDARTANRAARDLTVEI